MNDTAVNMPLAQRVADATPATVARRVRGLSDRAIAWLFVAPTIVLLLAINIFPLIWTIRLSFTNYRANRPNAPRPVAKSGSPAGSGVVTGVAAAGLPKLEDSALPRKPRTDD